MKKSLFFTLIAAMTLLASCTCVAAPEKPPKPDCEWVHPAPISYAITVANETIYIAVPMVQENSIKESAATSFVSFREGVGLFKKPAISIIDVCKSPTAGIYISRHRHIQYTLTPYEKPLTRFDFPRTVRILIRQLASC